MILLKKFYIRRDVFLMKNLNEPTEIIKFNKIDNEIDKINEQRIMRSISNIEENKKSLTIDSKFLFAS